MSKISRGFRSVKLGVSNPFRFVKGTGFVSGGFKILPSLLEKISSKKIIVKPAQQTVEFSEKPLAFQGQSCFITGCGSNPQTIKSEHLNKTNFITPASTGKKQSDSIGAGPTQSGIAKGALTPFTSPAGIALSIGGLLIFLVFFGGGK